MNTQVLNFMKICPLVAPLLCADGMYWGKDRQTDMTKLTVTFPNFANAPKKHRALGDNNGIEIHLFED